jgi:hypothetical protein
MILGMGIYSTECSCPTSTPPYRTPPNQLTLSRWRSAPKLMNLTFRSAFVCIVSPENPIFRRIPGLWRT